MTIRHRGRLVAIMLLAGLLSACAGTQQPYASSVEENLHFTTATESASTFSSVQASVHIHSVNENCQTNYRGSIELDQSSIVAGIPVGQPSYLVFSFDSSSFLANRSSSISYATLLTPRRNHDYDIAVEYFDDTYNATIEEVDRGSNRRREVQHQPLDACPV